WPVTTDWCKLYPGSLARATALYRGETDRSDACGAIPGLPERLIRQSKQVSHEHRWMMVREGPENRTAPVSAA
ncbi:MAG: hypothetical protein ACLP7F_03850, partial [Acidimicrobiales bacterium]